MLAVTLTLFASLLAPLVAAEAVSPFNPLIPYAVRRDVRYAKRQGCPGTLVDCGLDGCMPAGASCCNDDGAYCAVGKFCMTDGCCPVGEICTGAGPGTRTVDLGGTTDYAPPTGGGQGAPSYPAAANTGGGDISGDTAIGGPAAATAVGVQTTPAFGAVPSGLAGAATSAGPVMGGGTTVGPATGPATGVGAAPSESTTLSVMTPIAGDDDEPPPSSNQNNQNSAARRVAPAGGLVVAGLVAWIL